MKKLLLLILLASIAFINTNAQSPLPIITSGPAATAGTQQFGPTPCASIANISFGLSSLPQGATPSAIVNPGNIACTFNAVDSSFSFLTPAVGSYTLSVYFNYGTLTTQTDSNFTVVAPAVITLSVSAPNGDTICLGDSALFVANISGSTIIPTYQWKVNGNNVGTNSSSYLHINGNHNDTIGCEISSPYCILPNSVLTDSMILTVKPAPVLSITKSGYIPNSNISCPNQPVTLTASGSGSISWTGGVSNGVPFIPNPGIQQYTVVLTGTNGCQTDSTIVSNTAAPSPATITSSPANATVCAGNQMTLTQTPFGVQHAWTGGISNGVAFTPTATTTYYVTVLLAGYCLDTIGSQLVTVNPLPNITINASPNDTICIGDSVSLTASGGNIYTWSGGINNGVNFAPTATSTYTVTVSDTNNCSNTDSLQIVVNALPIISITTNPHDTICMGDSVQLLASGASSYAWTGGISNGVSFAPTASSSFTVTATDSNFCSNTTSQQIVVNALPIINIAVSPNDTICDGDGVSLTASGANSYVWSGGVSNGVNFYPSSTANYTVTASDTNNCSNSASQQIVVHAVPTINIAVSPNDTLCAGDSVKLTANSTSSVSWSGGITNGVNFAPTSTTTYLATATNSNNCSKTISQQIVVNALPIISILTSPHDSICVGDSVKLTASGASTYVWSGGIANGVNFAPTTSSSFTVTATDLNNCVNSATQSIVVNSLPTINIAVSPNDTLCLGDSLSLTASGASTYAWSGGISNGVNFTPTTSSTFTVTATNAHNCVDSATQNIVVNALPVVQANASDTSVCQGDSVMLYGSGTLSYTWNAGVTDSMMFIPISTQYYTVIGTDSNSCKNTDSIQVQLVNNITLSVALSSNPTPAVTGQSTIFTASIPPTVSNYQIDWYVNSNLNTSTTSPNNTFTHTTNGISDSVWCIVYPGNGCYKPDSVISAKIGFTYPSGIAAVESFKGIILYPNPTNNEIIIASQNEGIKIEEIVVQDLLGKVLLKEKDTLRKEVKLSLAHFANGQYHVLIKTTKGHQVRKVQVLR